MAKSRKSKKRKTDPEVFVVELITKARVVSPDSDDEDMSPKNTKSLSKGKEKQKGPKAKWEYYVKWAGYDSDADSWEPEENVASCTRLLQSFWDHVGSDNNDYLPGYEVAAKDSWIKKEKAFFVKEFKSEVSKGSEKSKSKTKRRKTSASKVSIKEESSDDDRPLALDFPPRPAPPRKPSAAIPKKRKRKVVPSEDEESDDAERPTNLEPAQKPAPMAPPAAAETQHGPVSNVVGTLPASQSPLFSASSLSPIPPPVEAKVLTPKLPPPTHKPQKPPLPPLPSRISHAKPLPSRPKVDTSDAVLPSKHELNFTRTPITSSVPTTSLSTGISTKQRVGLGATDHFQPKEVLFRPAVLPTRTTSDTLNNLSFKKNASPVAAVHHPQSDTPVDNRQKFAAPSAVYRPSYNSDTPADNRIFEPPANNPMLKSADRTPIVSPVVNAPPAPSGPSSTITTAHVYQDSSMREATEFLDSIMDSQMAAPLLPQSDTPTEFAPRALHKPSTAAEKASPRYKWEGHLALNSPNNVVCQVKWVETLPAQGLKFKIAVAEAQAIVVSDTYDITDVYSMMSIFRHYTHVGVLLPQDTPADKNSYRVLHKYFMKHLKAFFLPIIMDGATIGQILFCPLELLAPVLQAPRAQLQSETFGSIVLPYALSPKQKQMSMFSPKFLDAAPYPPLKVDSFPRWNSTLKRNPFFHLGLRILQFPRELFEWLLIPRDRTCAIFPAVPSSPEHEVQTHLLMSVVHQTPTPLLDIRAEARLIFIHNSALPALHTLPHLVERKLKLHPWPVHFYTYGSGTTLGTVQPVQEIYPCGGVITFSALAIYRNPLEVCHRIEQINKHPLWTCYLAPEVLGVLAKLLFGTADPIAELTKPHFPLGPILRRIEDGEIAYMHAPPDDQGKNGDWLKRCLSATSPSKEKALKMAVHDYLDLYKGAMSHLDMLQKLEHHMAVDMLKMQRQRALMANYRRFVILTAENEFNGPREGIEWVNVRRFDFKDMFFTQQDVGR